MSDKSVFNLVLMSLIFHTAFNNFFQQTEQDAS